MIVKKCEYCLCEDDVDTIESFSEYNLKIPENINIIPYDNEFKRYNHISTMENVFFCDNCVRLWQEYNSGKNIVNMIEDILL